jgi:hypothetical protein
MPTIVHDTEELYRAIKSKSKAYTQVDGRTVFSSSAFDDRMLTPSVDRSALILNPRYSMKSPSDGIAKLIAREVRTSCKIVIDPNAKGPSVEYAVDVIHRPILNDPVEPENLAHCQIECNPAISSNSRFKKLKEALLGVLQGTASSSLQVEPPAFCPEPAFSRFGLSIFVWMHPKVRCDFARLGKLDHVHRWPLDATGSGLF